VKGPGFLQDLYENIESLEPEPESDAKALKALRKVLSDGTDWPEAILKTIASWTCPTEIVNGRRYEYFIAGEAFDWLLLAERLCSEVREFIPPEEEEAFLFEGRFPDRFNIGSFKDAIGVQKHRGYLNYYYGVIVEEALQLASEREIHKRKVSNGNQYQDDFTEEVFQRLYRKSSDNLLASFFEDSGYACLTNMTMVHLKEFTYWLFKYRMKISDKARIASDTKKGLDILQQLSELKQCHPFME